MGEGIYMLIQYAGSGEDKKDWNFYSGVLPVAECHNLYRSQTSSPVPHKTGGQWGCAKRPGEQRGLCPLHKPRVWGSTRGQGSQCCSAPALQPRH